MDCGFGHSICDVIASILNTAEAAFPWLADRWQEITTGDPEVDALLGPITAGTKQLFDPLRPHLEAIFGVLGVAFAFWRWWRHRERVLHKRLFEYLAEEDRRLESSLEGMLLGIRNPTRRRSGRIPLLAPRELRKILKHNHWRTISIFTEVMQSTEADLSVVGAKVANQLTLLDRVRAGYREQQAAVHIIVGAIKSARATEHLIGTEEHRYHAEALESFRYALNVEGQSANLLALQYKADEERLLGNHQSALSTYEELELRASQTDDLRSKFFTIAQSRRRRAQVLMSLGSNGLANSQINEAIIALLQIAPMTGWEKLEEAEIHFTSAWIKSSLGFVVQEGTALDSASANFSMLLQNRLMWPILGGEKRALHRRGVWGLQLVSEARKRKRYRIDT